jgi:acyl-CoA synthetase (AMP-forming)/AMP-acid ligase II
MELGRDDRSAHATEWIGATRVPVDPGAPPAEAAAVFKAAGVSGVVVDAAHVTDAPAGALVHDDDSPLSATGTLEAREIPPDTTHLLYPRMAAQGQFLAVPMSYKNWAACMAINTELYRGGHFGKGFDGTERFLTVQQIMHGTGMLGTFPFIHMGLPQVILPRFDAAAVLEAAVRNRATATFMVPGMVTRLADAAALAGATLPQAGGLRRIIDGGAPIAADDLTRAVSIMGPVLVWATAGSKAAGPWPSSALLTMCTSSRAFAACRQLRTADPPDRPLDPAHPRPWHPLGRAMRTQRHGRRRLGRPRQLVRPRGPGQAR